MAVYRICAPARMRRWRRGLAATAGGFLLALLVLLIAHHDPHLSPSLWTSVTIVSFLGAFCCVLALLRTGAMERHFANVEFEVTPEGVSSYCPASNGGLITLALAGAPESRSHEDEPNYRFFARREITGFLSNPDGSTVVLARFWPTRLAVPAELNGMAQFRQELIGLGIPEIRGSHASYWFRRSVGIASVLLMLFCSCYLFLGTNAIGVIASGCVYFTFFGWSVLMAGRASGKPRAPAQRLQILTAAMMLLVVGLRVWAVTHPHPRHRAPTAVSVPDR